MGQHVRKYHGKLLITPAKSNVKALLEKVRSVIKQLGAATQADLITMLNPILRGWANYHRHVVENAIWHALWRWAVRRHPNKGARWIKRRYFKSIGHRHGCFVARTKEDGGNFKEMILTLASDCRIQRHIKIKATANPYDPQWQTYFETSKRRKSYPAVDSSM